MAGGLGESLILSLSGYPLLDREGGWTRGLTAKLGQRGGAPLLTFATEPLRNGETLSAPPPPLPWAGPPWSHRRGVACIDDASPVGIWWKKCPQKEYSHLGRGNGKSLEGYRGCWYTSSLQLYLALVSCIDVGQRVHWKPPFLLDHGGRRLSTWPGFLSLTHL